MEENSRPNRFNLFKFLGVIMFEVVFVSTVLLLIFGIFNYFNILPISDTFPKYLGWLPKQGVSNDISRKDVPSGTSLPTPTISFEENAKEAFAKFMKLNVSDTIMVNKDKFEIKQDAINPKTFYISWQAEAGTASGTLALDSNNSNSILYSYLEYPIFTSKENNPSVSSVKTDFSKFFSINPQGQWSCKNINNISYCQNFWEDLSKNIKTGIGINGVIPEKNGKYLITISACEFSKKSDLYNQDACISGL